jgi:hypothetical protein
LKIYLSLLFCLFGYLLFAGGPGAPYPVHHHHVNAYRNDSLRAKKDSADTMKVVRRKLIPGVSWASNNSFMGRTDTVDHQLTSPSIAYEGIYGFNASLALSHSSNLQPVKNAKGKVRKQPAFDEYDAALGWDHDWNKRISTTILNTHSWFDAKSARIRSVIDNDLNLGAIFDLEYLDAGLNADWCHGPTTKLGEMKDFFYTLSLSHDFDVGRIGCSHWELEVEPKISVIYGTQNFYRIYTKGVPIDTLVTTRAQYQQQLSKLNMLNILLSVPVTLTHAPWSFGLQYDYNMPQNVPAGRSNTPYPVLLVDLKLTLTGKTIRMKKKKWERGG